MKHNGQGENMMETVHSSMHNHGETFMQVYVSS